MDGQVLVAYGTKHGATAEIAERIGEVLRQAGLAADVVAAQNVTDVSRYQAVVLGSGVYAGQWVKAAVSFLEANEKALTERPVWLFSSGPTGEGDAVELLKGWRYPTNLQPLVDRIHARDMAVFHGVIDPKKISLFEKGIVRMVKAPTGDFRKWEVIEAWATAIAGALK